MAPLHLNTLADVALCRDDARLSHGNGAMRCAYCALRACQKLLHRLDEKVCLVVVHPMPGIIHHDDAGILEMTRAAVLLRIGGPAFPAVDEQGRTRDFRP